MTYKRALFFIFSSLEGSQEGKKGGRLLPPDFSQKNKKSNTVLPPIKSFSFWWNHTRSPENFKGGSVSSSGEQLRCVSSSGEQLR